MAPRSASKTAKPAPAKRPLLQWIMAALGGLVTLAVIGVVVWEAVQPDTPPELTARIVEVSRTSTGHVAEVKISNAGTSTAAAVDLEGVVGQETATATVDYVPGRGHATAWLYFTADPRAASVTVRGWSEP